MVIKKQGTKLILFLPGIISVFFIFLGAVSIAVGIENRHEEGYKIAVLCGLVLIIFALVLFYCSARRLLEKTKEKEIINQA
ncbi:hypothetical protein ACFL1N_17330 [Thermodesulfobacteriota bacterium]